MDISAYGPTYGGDRLDWSLVNLVTLLNYYTNILYIDEMIRKLITTIWTTPLIMLQIS